MEYLVGAVVVLIVWMLVTIRKRKRYFAEQFANEKSSKVPWSPDDWKRATQMLPDFLRASFRAVGKTPEQILTDDWSLGYVWGYFTGWIKTLPMQTIEAAAPELGKAGFEALFGSAGPKTYYGCLKGLSGDTALASGAKAGEIDWRSTVSAIGAYHQDKIQASEAMQPIQRPKSITTHELFRHFGVEPPDFEH